MDEIELPHEPSECSDCAELHRRYCEVLQRVDQQIRHCKSLNEIGWPMIELSPSEFAHLYGIPTVSGE